MKIISDVDYQHYDIKRYKTPQFTVDGKCPPKHLTYYTYDRSSIVFIAVDPYSDDGGYGC